jgi:hypothetical protein
MVHHSHRHPVPGRSRIVVVGLLVLALLTVAAGDLVAGPGENGDVHRQDEPVGDCDCRYCAPEHIELELNIPNVLSDLCEACQTETDAEDDQDHSCRDCANCLCCLQTLQMIADLEPEHASIDRTLDWIVLSKQLSSNISPVFPIDHPPQNLA